MTWVLVEQYLGDFLAMCLIVRVLSMRVQMSSIYGVFCVFLGSQVLESAIALVEYALRDRHLVDYRLTWMTMRATAWVLSLWMVYALLSAILKKLPGVLRFSKILLNVVFAVAALLTVVTIKTEYAVSGAASHRSPIARMVVTWYVLDRAFATVALLLLASILAFIFWFPVQMPKNLPVLSSGLLVYFAVKTSLWLIRNYLSLSPHDTQMISIAINSILPFCFAYWLFFITPQGMTEQVRTGRVWRTNEQQNLIGQLESMNAALLRSARR